MYANGSVACAPANAGFGVSTANTSGNNPDEEAEMIERDLAEDAEWKKIQQNTFTRWANEHLRFANNHIDDLEIDLSDGLKLIQLIEVLAAKRLPKHNKKPRIRSQKLENISVALKFLDDQGIRIINIGELPCISTVSVSTVFGD